MVSLSFKDAFAIPLVGVGMQARVPVCGVCIIYIFPCLSVGVGMKTVSDWLLTSCQWHRVTTASLSSKDAFVIPLVGVGRACVIFHNV